MRKVYPLLLALGVATSLMSCSKSTYSFNAAPAYLRTQSVSAVAKAKQVAGAAGPVAAATEPEPAPPVARRAPVAKAKPTEAAVVAIIAPTAANAVTAPTVATAPVARKLAQAGKPTLFQRLAVKQVVKQITKMQRQQAVAGTERTQSQAGRGLLTALLGLLLALIGLILLSGSSLSGSFGGILIGAALLCAGIIIFIVGLVLGVVALVSES